MQLQTHGHQRWLENYDSRRAISRDYSETPVNSFRRLWRTLLAFTLADAVDRHCIAVIAALGDAELFKRRSRRRAGLGKSVGGLKLFHRLNRRVVVLTGGRAFEVAGFNQGVWNFGDALAGNAAAGRARRGGGNWSRFRFRTRAHVTIAHDAATVTAAHDDALAPQPPAALATRQFAPFAPRQFAVPRRAF